MKGYPDIPKAEHVGRIAELRFVATKMVRRLIHKEVQLEPGLDYGQYVSAGIREAEDWKQPPRE